MTGTSLTPAAPATRERAGAAATAHAASDLRASATAALAEIVLRARAAERLAHAGDAGAPAALDALREVAAAAMEEARERFAEFPRATGGRCGDELHDALGHALSLAGLLAGAAATQLPTDPRAAAAMLGELASTTAAARADLTPREQPRRARPADAEPAPFAAGAARHAAPALRALALGQPVTFELDDALLGGLREPVAAAIHGIVREALTNARVHAPGAPVRVRLIVAPSGDALLLTVVSEPADSPRRPGSGRGLAGMRRRAHALGGSFDAGNAVGGGFRIAARLPR